MSVLSPPNIPPNGIAGTAGGVSNDTSRLASAENLDKAGQRFEAIFVGMMLKSMRQASIATGIFDTKAGAQFRDLQDGKLAESMAAHAPIGIGRAMTEFLAKTHPVADATSNEGVADATPNEGVADATRSEGVAP